MKRVAEFWGCVALVWLLYTNALRAQTIDFTNVQDGVKYVATQGGLTIALLVMGFSYRRDLMRASDEARREADARKAEAAAKVAEKEQQLEVLVELVRANTSSNAELVATVKALAVDIRDRRSGDDRRGGRS